MQNLVDALYLNFVAVDDDQITVHLIAQYADTHHVRSVFGTLEHYWLVSVVAVRVNFFDKSDFNLVRVCVHRRNYLRQCQVVERVADG